MEMEVFFEGRGTAIKVLEIDDGDLYLELLPKLEEIAKNNNMIVTESVKE